MNLDLFTRVEDEMPKEYGRYMVHRDGGKIHLETWNGTGWAYNHNAITHWLDLSKLTTKEKAINLAHKCSEYSNCEMPYFIVRKANQIL